jgi:hypothetical protein
MGSGRSRAKSARSCEACRIISSVNNNNVRHSHGIVSVCQRARSRATERHVALPRCDRTEELFHRLEKQMLSWRNRVIVIQQSTGNMILELCLICVEYEFQSAWPPVHTWHAWNDRRLPNEPQCLVSDHACLFPPAQYWSWYKPIFMYSLSSFSNYAPLSWRLHFYLSADDRSWYQIGIGCPCSKPHLPPGPRLWAISLLASEWASWTDTTPETDGSARFFIDIYIDLARQRLLIAGKSKKTIILGHQSDDRQMSNETPGCASHNVDNGCCTILGSYDYFDDLVPVVIRMRRSCDRSVTTVVVTPIPQSPDHESALSQYAKLQSSALLQAYPSFNNI